MAIRKLAPLRLLSTTAICHAVISMRGLALVNSGLSTFDRRNSLLIIASRLSLG